MKLTKSERTKLFCYGIRRELAGFVVDVGTLRQIFAECLDIESKPGFYNKLDTPYVEKALERVKEGEYLVHPTPLEPSLEPLEQTSA